ALTAGTGLTFGTSSLAVNLTSSEFTQLQNINSVTVSNTQWGYLGALDQGLAQASSPTFAGLTLTNLLTVTSGAVTVNPASGDVDTVINYDGGVALSVDGG